MKNHELKITLARYFGTAIAFIFGLALAAVLVADVADQFGKYPALATATGIGVLLVSVADYYRDSDA